METHQAMIAAWGSIEAWNRAYEKVEHYLRAHRVESRLHRAHLTTLILGQLAAQGSVANPPPDDQIEPLAIRCCRDLMSKWVTEILSAGKPTATGVDPIDGRLALLLSDAPNRWPYAFMVTEQTPETMRRALHESSLKAGPRLAVSHMVPRDIDLGLLPELAGSTMATFARWPMLKTILAWLAWLALVTILFLRTR